MSAQPCTTLAGTITTSPTFTSTLREPYAVPPQEGPFPLVLGEVECQPIGNCSLGGPSESPEEVGSGCRKQVISTQSVDITTPDGVADAYLARPDEHPHPGVLFTTVPWIRTILPASSPRCAIASATVLPFGPVARATGATGASLLEALVCGSPAGLACGSAPIAPCGLAPDGMATAPCAKSC